MAHFIAISYIVCFIRVYQMAHFIATPYIVCLIRVYQMAHFIATPYTVCFFHVYQTAHFIATPYTLCFFCVYQMHTMWVHSACFASSAFIKLHTLSYISDYVVLIWFCCFIFRMDRNRAMENITNSPDSTLSLCFI